MLIVKKINVLLLKGNEKNLLILTIKKLFIFIQSNKIIIRYNNKMIKNYN